MSSTVVVADVRAIVADVLKVSESELPGSADLRALPGIDSVKILRIVTRLEQRHDIELSEDVVFKLVTLQDLEALVRDTAARRPQRSRWRG